MQSGLQFGDDLLSNGVKMRFIPANLVDEVIVFSVFIIFSFTIWFNYNVEPVYPDYKVDCLHKADLTSPLFAGSATVDITPEIVDTWDDVDGNGRYDRWVDIWYDNNKNGYFDARWMAGFERSKPATSTLEPLSIRAVVLKKGDFSLGLVTIDTIGFPYGETIKTRLEEPEAKDLNHLVIASIHTHSAPDTMGYWTPYEVGTDRQYIKFLRGKINEALAKAKAAMVPSDTRITSINISDQTTDARIPPYKTVPQMTGIELVPIDDHDSKPIVMAFAGCHPTLLGRGSNQLSSDWVGYLRKEIENNSDSSKECIFFNGAIGGQVIPAAKEGNGVSFDERVQSAKDMGKVMGSRLSQALNTAPLTSGSLSRLSARAQTIYLPIENKMLWLAIGIGYFGRGTFFPMKTRTEVGILEIGEMKAITLPGELFPEQFIGGEINPYGADFQSPPVEVPPLMEVIGSRYPVLMGLANDEIGYIVPYSEWDVKKPHLNHRKSSYEHESLSLGPHTADLLHKAIINLNNR